MQRWQAHHDYIGRMSVTRSRTFPDSASAASTPAEKWRINRMSARTCSPSHNSRTQPLHFHFACQHRTLFGASVSSNDCLSLRAGCASYVSQPAPNMPRACKAWRFRFDSLDSGEGIRTVSIWCCRLGMDSCWPACPKIVLCECGFRSGPRLCTSRKVWMSNLANGSV